MDVPDARRDSMFLWRTKLDYNYITYCYPVAKSPQPNQGRRCTVLPNIFCVLILSRVLIHMLFKVSLALLKKHRRDSHLFQHECSLWFRSILFTVEIKKLKLHLKARNSWEMPAVAEEGISHICFQYTAVHCVLVPRLNSFSKSSTIWVISVSLKLTSYCVKIKQGYWFITINFRSTSVPVTHAASGKSGTLSLLRLTAENPKEVNKLTEQNQQRKMWQLDEVSGHP